MTTMTFEQFRSTGRDTADIGAEPETLNVVRGAATEIRQRWDITTEDERNTLGELLADELTQGEESCP